jgi:hypothetical protein
MGWTIWRRSTGSIAPFNVEYRAGQRAVWRRSTWNFAPVNGQYGAGQREPVVEEERVDVAGAATETVTARRARR